MSDRAGGARDRVLVCALVLLAQVLALALATAWFRVVPRGGGGALAALALAVPGAFVIGLPVAGLRLLAPGRAPWPLIVSVASAACLAALGGAAGRLAEGGSAAPPLALLLVAGSVAGSLLGLELRPPGGRQRAAKED